jgi:CheY-like chemotaxis protein
VQSTGVLWLKSCLQSEDGLKEPEGTQKHVLLVEDYPAVQAMLTAWLKLQGYSVSPAHNGLEALLSLESRLPCLILLDLKMPNMDGYTFLEALERRKFLSSIPVIVLTADMRAASALAQKPVDILFKPFKFDLLLSTMQKYC